MLKNLFVMVFCIALLGCETVHHYEKQKAVITDLQILEVSLGYIHAQGTVATAERGGALLRAMQIDLAAATSEFLEDTWVEIRIVGRTKLAKVTPTLLKEQGFNEISIEPPRDGATVRYRSTGFSFDFNRDGKLIRLEADTGTNDDTSTENPRIGSLMKKKILSLPGSLPEYEAVFGKPDEIRIIPKE